MILQQGILLFLTFKFNNIMAKSSSRSTTSSSTSTKSNPNRSSNRPNPMIPKASVTRSGRRSYGDGGKVK